jgi:hypothetical protein
MAKKTAKKASKKSSLSMRIAEAKSNNENFKNTVAKRGEKFFKEAVKEIFKKFKDLESFSWSQYTPHFNDGDECLFSCHFDSLAINGEEDPECVYHLEHICELLSQKQKEETRIIMELSNKTGKQDWDIIQLKQDLEIIKTRDLEEVSNKLETKRYILDLVENIDETAYENMFGEGTVVVSRDGITVEECEHD